jgi:predicted phosphodiesterase
MTPPAMARMQIQLLSDLHLETETYEPQPLEGADVLVLAGDIDTTWRGYRHFAHWPTPVLVVPGNHEYDGRDWDSARDGLRSMCEGLGMVWLDRAKHVMTDPATGQPVEFVGVTRWSDYDLYGDSVRAKALRVGAYFAKYMDATKDGVPLDVQGIRELGRSDRLWLEAQLATPKGSTRRVVVTHFAPSGLSHDRRFGHQPSTASFCNADDDLLPRADLWLHGHVHARHDYWVGTTRVVSQARGIASKGEVQGHEDRLISTR